MENVSESLFVLLLGSILLNVPRQAGLSSVALESYCSLRQPLQSEQKKGKDGSSLKPIF